ncbi:MAG: flagellar hook-associated protein FlgL [bacterium]|jgi:flagellar hook-associated protein 3 FlgL
MRVTQGMINTTFKRDLNYNLRQLAKYQHQLAVGKRISRPSDDPVGIVHSLRLRADLDDIATYSTNVDHALSWLGSTEDALLHASDIIQRVSDLAIAGANGTNPKAALDAIADEIDQLLEHMVQIANSSQAGQYLFGGTKTKAAAGETYVPFELIREDGKPSYVQYNGNDTARATEIGAGIEFTYNVTGKQAFSDDIFNSLIELSHNLREGNTDDISSSTIGKLQQALDHLVAQRSEVGAKVNRLEMTESRLGSADINFTALLSKTEDLDAAEAMIYLKTQEAVYRAALATGARIMQPTLVDFLR